MGKKEDFLSLDWFRARADKALTKAAVKIVKDVAKADKKAESKLYRHLNLCNDTLTLVLNDGSVITKPGATQNDFILARGAKTETELIGIVATYEVAMDQERVVKEGLRLAALQKGVESLKALKEFSIEDDCVYLKGIKRSIPQLLVEKFVEVVGAIEFHKGENNTVELEESLIEFDSLKKFWLKCCLNPNAQSAEDLYVFLNKHQFKIDRHGNFYAYRRVVSRANPNKALVEFVSNAYTKVKAVWKKSPKNYLVYSGNQGFYISESKTQDTLVGVLESLYLDLPNYQSNSYTSAHTGKEDYRIGSAISMERHEGNDNNNVSCSRGFHAASKAYNYSGFGDTPILVIINPMDVLAVPKGEDGKLRTCRWFFATTLSTKEEHILDDEDYKVADLGDVFEEQCSTNLTDYVQMSFAQEVKRHTFTIPQISNTEVKNIIDTLAQMKAKVAKRVVKI